MAEVLRTATEPKYCALAIYVAGNDDPTLLSVNLKVVLFDTKVIAQQFMPLLGNGRIPRWSMDGETITFLEFDPTGFNRACIITAYDPYNLPAGMPEGISSETAGLEWHSHIMWSHVWFDCGQWERRANGKMFNTAIGEQRGAENPQPEVL